MSAFWSIWISIITLGVIVGVTWLLFATRKSEKFKETTEETVGHSFDGIEEYDNPLPKWWFNMFLITVVFALGYLALYPGLGNFKGLLGWTSTNQWEKEMAHAEQVYKPVFAKYAALSIEELNQPGNENGLKMGQRMFANNCSVCHGVGGVGAYGFPNLTDDDWLYGGSPETIVQTLINGRQGGMPAFAATLGEDGVQDVSHYVRSLSGQDHDVAAADRGQATFNSVCAACHMPTGEGMQALGAPNLTDNVWLYGGDFAQIAHTIRAGRAGVMPAQKDLLSEDKIQLIAAYVYSFSK